ncbi:hypothetical protein [Paenibacillus mendelii]|uniref:Uncharacterized protein n=1 Tax=Paenibacillus mendelii TaxID=206163 RepID=A0ABV6JCW9_9BACL|nr:hypothetical protein [Paenibacillus mendelii]MCQ6562478.1 hypothetical protein [Paenibacillus mendelii]
MSAKVKVSNVKVVRKTKKRARVSSSSSSCKERCDEAVEAVQEAGADLSDLFGQLKHRMAAKELVRAIRCKNRRLVEHLIGFNCNVVRFFDQDRQSCVRISCTFGDCCDVRITFDICVSNEHCRNLVGGRSDENNRGCNQYGRGNMYGNNGYNGYNGNGY